MKNRTHIALVLPRGYAHFERLVEGVMSYGAAENRRWSYIMMPDHLGYAISQLKGWTGDGAIALLDTKAEAKAALSTGFPVVNVSSALNLSAVPQVIVDNKAIGRLAAEHLLSLCFRRFAFYGVDGLAYSRLRLEGFRERLAEEGFRCQIHTDPSASSRKKGSWLQRQQKLEQWLQTLDAPIGLFAAFDHLACMVLDACTVLERSVPDEIAILGCNNEDTICEHSITPLSSISRNMRQVGASAAEMLDTFMSGKKPASTHVLIQPRGVVQRASTDTLAVDDPRLGKAVRFIHSHFHQPTGIEAILDVLPISRRWLEYGFRKQFGVSPYRYLLNLRLRKAKELLSSQRSMSIMDVAVNCGFTHSKQLSAIMRREDGCSAMEYRRRTATT